MKFETVRKMESEIAGFTHKNQLDGDISFMSQGKEIFLKNIGSSINTGATETIYMGTETADCLRVRYETDGENIKVIQTHLTRG